MRTDLQEYLRDGVYPELARTAQCLAAEAAILMGDADTAGLVATSWSWPDLARPADARLAIAAANARRISGDTSAAGRLYDAVWRHHAGPARHTAGLWVADIHMWQGRFVTAFALCREILDSADPGAQELQGDVLRLMHLGYRFHLDFAAAATTLQQARECYQHSGAVAGLADITTNQVELLAWTNPATALVAAPAALEAQQELGALHELGKTHTAIAIAQTRLGDHSEAAESFETACTYLERARYRSGLARAEFFRAFLHASQGHPDRAAACLTRAVGEFVAAEVYPTLIVLAAQALDHLGQPDPDVTRAADAARAGIEPLDSITDLEQRAAALIVAMLGGMTGEWQDIYDTATALLEAAAGYYNNNVRVDTPTGPVNVRIPIPGADVMDLRLWREEEILPALAGYVKNAPPLLHSSNEPRYQVHGFIDGAVLNTIAPRGVAVPSHVPADVVSLLTELTTIPRGRLPATPAGWPQDDDTITFARRLSGLTHQVYATYQDQYSPQFQAFRFPADPLAAAEAAWPALTRRPLVCVHSDIHRKNMIIKGEVSYFLDWELALWGDPVYDLAVHFHKMGYTPAERDHVLELWQAALRPEHTVGWERDLDVYLAHEQIKSAIVDTVRYSQAFLDPSYPPEPGHALVSKLTGKLNNAYRRWGMTDRVDVAVVETTLLAWAESRRRRW